MARTATGRTRHSRTDSSAKQDLPIPKWLFAWAACVVLVASLAGLATLWPTARMQRPHERTLARVPRAVARTGRRLGLEPPEPLAYPRALGGSPAVAGILAFAWVEHVYVNKDDPSTLAVLALAYAHDRAIASYEDPAGAVRSQYWMLAVMVRFTSLGLWLLSNTGQ